MILRWLGVAGIELRSENRVLLVDPFFTRPPWWRMLGGRVEPNRALSAQHAPDCDLCLITHAHFDHLMDAPEIARRTGAQAIGSPNTCALLTACGVRAEQVRQVQPGDEIAFPPFRIRALPGEHHPIPGYMPGPLPRRLSPPLRLKDYRMDRVYSYAIDVGGLRVLHWSSMRAAHACRADVLLVYGIESYAFYRALLPAVRPRLVVPIHWDNFFRPLSHPPRPAFTFPRWTCPPLQRVDMARLQRWVERIEPKSTVLTPSRLVEIDLHAQLACQ